MKLNKKNLIIGGCTLLLVVSIIIAIALFNANNTDAAKFKKEYESYNSKVAYKDLKYQDLDIPKKNKVKYATLKEAVDIIKDGTGLIYFGYPNCPWCRGMLPALLDVVDCSCLENLYYVDMTGLRDTYEVNEDGNIVLKEKASDEYYELLKVLDGHLLDYTITDKNGIEHSAGEKRIYVPLVVGVKDGTVVGSHTDSVPLNDGQSAFDKLTDVQKETLKVIYENIIELVTADNDNYVCDEHC